MSYQADHSRQKRPLWELFVMIFVFLGIALMARLPAEIGKHMAKSAGAKQTEVQATRSYKE